MRDARVEDEQGFLLLLLESLVRVAAEHSAKAFQRWCAGGSLALWRFPGCFWQDAALGLRGGWAFHRCRHPATARLCSLKLRLSAAALSPPPSLLLRIDFSPLQKDAQEISSDLVPCVQAYTGLEEGWRGLCCRTTPFSEFLKKRRGKTETSSEASWTEGITKSNWWRVKPEGTGAQNLNRSWSSQARGSRDIENPGPCPPQPMGF